MTEKTNISDKFAQIVSSYCGDRVDHIEETLGFLLSGYYKNTGDFMEKSLIDFSGARQLITIENIDLYTTCRHHFMPVIGEVKIAYMPDKKILGVGAFADLVEIFAKRLQIQEELTEQIAQILQKYLQPKYIEIEISAQHYCSVVVNGKKSKLVTKCCFGDK